MLAHGIGERGDLPLPLYLFTWGMVLALVISFVALGVLWTEPRLARASTGERVVDYRTVQVLHWLGRIAGFALYLVCMYAAFFGVDARDRNILPVTFYVVVWVGAQLIGGLIGDVWGAINPIATLARGAEGLSRMMGREPGKGPTGWGHWPAALGLSIFLFYELSHPSGADPRTLGRLLLIHGLLTIGFGFAWGSRWVVDHEPFTVFFAKVGSMAPLFVGRDPQPRRSNGRRPAPDDESAANRGGLALRVRPPMAGLSTMDVRPGTVMLILIAIGGTSFDGFSESELGRTVFGDLFGWSLAWAELGGLVVSVTIVTLLYYIGIWWTTRVTGIGFNRAWQEFAPSLIPIAFGYAVAHYFQLFSDESQSFVFRLSDPFGEGWDLFGGADGLIWRIGPTEVAWIQVGAILFGHVGAVAVAHDRAIEIFPTGKSLQSQFAMLFVMVGYSSLGLWLLLTA
ncbi:MAG: hypothetical protein ACR2QK_00685 [Acidimicrobiales bacterium]